MGAGAKPYLIDCLQYSKWSEAIFREMREGGIDAVHATIAYHEDFREAVERIIDWNRLFEAHSDLIMPGRTAADIDQARQTNRTAIFFGFQNPSPIEDDIGLIEICYKLGVRFMQLSYNNQSLLAAGCTESEDPGITRMGREAIREMNRLGMVIDMSHSAERSTLQAIELSQRPIAITHANPSSWHSVARNKSDEVLKVLAQSGGMLGFSLYPLHLKGGSGCPLQAFCEMAARTAELIGVEHIGIGSDRCQDQPDTVVEWMRNGRWTRGEANIGLGRPVFPPPVSWFRDNRDFGGIKEGLRNAGFSQQDADKVMGGNWYRYFKSSFGPAVPDKACIAS